MVLSIACVLLMSRTYHDICDGGALHLVCLATFPVIGVELVNLTRFYTLHNEYWVATNQIQIRIEIQNSLLSLITHW